MVDDVAAPPHDAKDLLHFNCPRCERDVAEAYYGPCGACLADLKTIYKGQAREIDVADYVPKMNVTPNAVALKDD